MYLSDIPAGTTLYIDSKNKNQEIICNAIGPLDGGLLVTNPMCNGTPLNSLENFTFHFTDDQNNSFKINCASLKPAGILNGRFHLMEGLQSIEMPKPKRRSERHVVAVYGTITPEREAPRKVLIYDISMNGLSFVDTLGRKYYNGQSLEFNFTSRTFGMKVSGRAEVNRHFDMRQNVAIGCRVFNPSIEMINYISAIRKAREERLRKEKERNE